MRKPGFKTCPICKIEKTLDGFDTYFSKERNRYRPQNYCKECQPAEKTKRSAEYYQRNREVRLEYCTEYRDKNRDWINSKRKKYKKLYVENLQTCYVVEQAARNLKLPVEIINKEPELIELYRNRIKLKRAIKKHGKK